MTFFDGLAHGKSASREMFCQPAEIVLVSTSAHGAALPSALASANVGSPQLFLIPRSTPMTGSGQKPEAHYPTRGLPLNADSGPHGGISGAVGVQPEAVGHAAPGRRTLLPHCRHGVVTHRDCAQTWGPPSIARRAGGVAASG